MNQEHGFGARADQQAFPNTKGGEEIKAVAVAKTGFFNALDDEGNQLDMVDLGRLGFFCGGGLFKTL